MAHSPGQPATLLCWHSERAGLKVLLDALRLLKKAGHPIRRLIYLLQSEEDREHLRSIPAEIEVNALVIKLRDVSSHRAIYDAVKAEVLPLLVDYPGPLHINVSPGTPAMHTVWLLLHASGAFPEGTRLWSGQIDKDKNTRIDPVDFEINTYLSEIRRSAAARPHEARYDPESRSPARRDALEQLKRFARVRGAPLLLLGERGTGKSRLCETLVKDLKGRTKIVTVPCGTLDPHLAMSLLFGHVKGAFTGAEKEQKGFIEEADKGVLFLDEVQDLPKPVQRQLVRFLQDAHRRYRRVGEQKERTADVEVVCASHLPLPALRGKLDEDLFDRLSLLFIEIPPLRACRDDTKGDFVKVWRELRKQQDLDDVPPWNGDIEQALRGDELRGNLRDLQRLALLIMTEAGGTSNPRDVARAVKAWRDQQERLRTSEQSSDRALLQEGETWNSAVDRLCYELANEVHARFGSFAKAAEALEVSERTLRKHRGSKPRAKDRLGH